MSGKTGKPGQLSSNNNLSAGELHIRSRFFGGKKMEILAPQDFLSILHQVCDKVIKVSVFTCFLATAVTIKIIIIIIIILIIIIIILILIIIIIIINNPFLLHENYVPLIKFKFKFI